jgi:hypothetical protein
MQDLELKLTQAEIEDMIHDASTTDGSCVDEFEYVHILKNSTWI